MFKKLGKNLSKTQAREIMKEVDTDGSGEIEFEELCILEIKMSNPRPRADLIKYEDYLAPKLVTRLEDLFVRKDSACKGTISVADVKFSLETAGCTASEEEIEEIVNDVDKTGCGNLDFRQFAAVWAIATKSRRRVNYREFLDSQEIVQMRKMFRDADPTGTGDGEISAAELDQLFRRMSYPLKTKQLKALLRDFDSDGSGEISFEEFCIMMLRLKGARRQRKISPATHDCKSLFLDEKFTVKELLQSGYTVENMKAASIPVGQILATGDTSALEMRRCGYTASELRKGGMGANELRVSGFSLSELRVAGFSNVILSQTNRVLRKCLSAGNVYVLPQQNPSLNPRQFKSAMYGMIRGKWSNAPKAVTPRIREHTDWRPAPTKPARVRTAPARANFGPLDLPDLPGRPMTADN